MRHLSTASEGAQGLSQELFRARLDALIDLSHPLAKLAREMPWAEIESAVSRTLPPAPAGAGRSALPIRLMVGLLYLKHAYNLSDEATCERWFENCYWQYFTGEVYIQTRLPCDPSSFTRWRNRLGEAGLKELLAQTLEAATGLRAVKPRSNSIPTRPRGGSQLAADNEYRSWVRGHRCFDRRASVRDRVSRTGRSQTCADVFGSVVTGVNGHGCVTFTSQPHRKWGDYPVPTS